MPIVENKTAIEFLLGRASDVAREGLEEMFVTDQQAFEEILQAENDLIDDYVAQRLSDDDHRRFESVLLPRLQDRVGFARALAAYTKVGAEDKPAAVALGWGDSIRQMFSFPPGFAIGLSAVVVLIVAAVVLLINRAAERDMASVTPAPVLANSERPTLGSMPSPTSEPAAAPRSSVTPTPNARNQKPPVGSHRLSVIATIALSPGLTRAGGDGAAFTLPPKDGLVTLRLLPEQGDFRRFAVIVETVDGQQVWQQNVTPGLQNIRANIPRKRLSRGDYIVTVKGIGPGGIADVLNEYAFTIKN